MGVMGRRGSVCGRGYRCTGRVFFYTNSGVRNTKGKVRKSGGREANKRRHALGLKLRPGREHKVMCDKNQNVECTI